MNRDIDGLYFNFYHSNSPEICIRTCSQYNFKYAAVQFGKQCFCGDEHGKYGMVESSKCNMNCPNNNSKCGGKWANDVYQINYMSIINL